MKKVRLLACPTVFALQRYGGTTPQLTCDLASLQRLYSVLTARRFRHHDDCTLQRFHVIGETFGELVVLRRIEPPHENAPQQVFRSIPVEVQFQRGCHVKPCTLFFRRSIAPQDLIDRRLRVCKCTGTTSAILPRLRVTSLSGIHRVRRTRTRRRSKQEANCCARQFIDECMQSTSTTFVRKCGSPLLRSELEGILAKDAS